MMAATAERAGEPGRLRRLIVALSALVLIAGLYLPMLAAPFDFVDDGNLVYPAAPMPVLDHLRITWGKIVANYRDLGPFRPVLWAHWDLQAELLGADALRWRVWRLAWMSATALLFLWLLRELRIAPGAALAITALAMWSAPTSEIWRSLTLSEGVAMPYAIGALICAVRGGRSRTPGRWDSAGVLCSVAALGCKNTFAAIVPAQLLLRLAPDGEALVGAVRAHGRRAAWLALPLLLPLIHYAIFMRGWHDGQYAPGLPTWSQLAAVLDRVQAAAALGFLAPALLLAVACALSSIGTHHRAACRAGVALLLFGIAVYLPMPAVAGRYAIPAVWGAYLLMAALLSEMRLRAAPRWRRLTFALFALGLAGVAAENLLRQEKQIARSALLWEELAFVERTAPPGAALAWLNGAGGLDPGEGIHFYWHLVHRGRSDLSMQLLNASGGTEARPELPAATGQPAILLTASGASPPAGRWVLERRIERSYRFGQRHYAGLVWTRPSLSGADSP